MVGMCMYVCMYVYVSMRRSQRREALRELNELAGEVNIDAAKLHVKTASPSQVDRLVRLLKGRLQTPASLQRLRAARSSKMGRQWWPVQQAPATGRPDAACIPG